MYLHETYEEMTIAVNQSIVSSINGVLVQNYLQVETNQGTISRTY